MIRRLFCVCSICLLATLIFIPAQVQARDLSFPDSTQSIFDPTGGGLTPGLTYVMYSGQDFEPNSSTLGYDSTGPFRNATFLDGAGFSMRLDLPQGSQVFEIMFLYKDNSAQNIDFYVTTYNPSLPLKTDLLTGSTAGMISSLNIRGYTFFNTNGAALFTIDNTIQEYRLRTRLNEATNNQVITGVRVGYKRSAGTFQSDRYKTYSCHSFNSPTSTLQFTNNMTGVYANQLAPGFGFNARLDLPNGAKVKNVRFYLVDNSTLNINLHVSMGNPEEVSYTNIVDTNTSTLANSASVQSMEFSANPLFVVDNTLFAYRLMVELTETGFNQQIIGAQVHYTVDHEEYGSLVKTYISQELFPANSSSLFAQTGTGMYPTSAPDMHGFSLPTNLPTGAKINLARFYSIDNNDQSISLSVQRNEPANGSYLMYLTSTPALPVSSAVQSKDLSLASYNFTDSPSYNYRVVMIPPLSGSSNVLKGVRIYYTVPTIYIPLAVK